MDADDEPHKLTFIWDDGRPCNIFVEATSVRERPKLVRKIIKHGGVVVNAVREADILLAENNTKEALELLDAWWGDKVILGTRWAALCVDQGRFLGEDYGWAGCQLSRESLVKGISMQNDDSEEDSQGEQISAMRVLRSRPKASPQPKSEPHLHTSDLASPSGTQRRQTAHSGRGSERKHSASRTSQNVTPSEERPNHESNTPIAIDPGPSSSQYQYPSSQEHAQQLFSPMLNHLLQQSPPQQQMTNLFPSPALSQFASFAPLAASYSQFTPSQMQLLQQLMMNSHLLNPQATEQQSSAVQRQQPTGYDKTSEHSTPEDVMSSDAAYVKSEDDEPKTSPRKSKGKARARSDSCDGDIQTAIRSRPIPSKPIIKNRGLFVDDQGNPKMFYVMVDLKNRKDLLKIAKKHQGKIVSEMEHADYIILNTRSNQYQALLGTLPVSKIALAPAWLEACDEQGRVVGMAPFVIDITSGVGPGALRKRPPVNKRSNAGTQESEEENPPCLKQAQATTVTSPHRPFESVMDSRSTSHSPEPPTLIVPFNSGKNIFTPEDRTWFFKYVRFKLKRDPDLSMISLLKSVASRAPHHSAKSWENRWRKSWGDEMAALKKDLARLRNHSATDAPAPTSSSPSTVLKTQYRSPQPSPLSQKTISTLSSPPRVPKNQRDVLQYPDNSPSPSSSALEPQPPPNSAPVSQTSAPVTPIRMEPESLKRKESPLEAHPRHPNDNRQGKKAKVQPEDILDVDSYPDLWPKTHR